MNSSDKTREARLRATAHRRGLRLQKSRRRDPYALDFGTYCLIDPIANSVVASSEWCDHGLSLDDIEKILNEEGMSARKHAFRRRSENR